MTANPREFIRDVLRLMYESCCDVDGSDLQDAAEKHGLLETRPLTAEQIADENGPWHEYQLREGDGWLFWTDELVVWLADEPQDGEGGA